MGKKEELDKKRRDLLMERSKGITKDVANFVFTKIEPSRSTDLTKVVQQPTH